MEKSNKIYLGIILVCTILVIGLCGYAIINHKDEKLSDAEKFKLEYESLNGVENDYSESGYMEVSIPSENPINYKTGKEILEVMEGDALIYFGFSACPWCRNAVPVLIETAIEENIKTVYYVDILNIRDTYKFSGSIKPELVSEGTPAYYDIVEKLNDYLDKYYVQDENGNMYDTGVKRLLAPTVVAIKSGEVVGFHAGTVKSQTNPYEVLNEEQTKELKEVYKRMIESIKSDKCTSEGAC